MHTTRLLDSQVGQKAASGLGAASVQSDLRIAFDEAARSTNKAEYRACFSLGVDVGFRMSTSFLQCAGRRPSNKLGLGLRLETTRLPGYGN